MNVICVQIEDAEIAERASGPFRDGTRLSLQNDVSNVAVSEQILFDRVPTSRSFC
jgi:hypothetical protein